MEKLDKALSPRKSVTANCPVEGTMGIREKCVSRNFHGALTRARSTTAINSPASTGLSSIATAPAAKIRFRNAWLLMGAYHNGGGCSRNRLEVIEKLQSRHAGHMVIDDQAAAGARLEIGQEIGRRGIAADPHIGCFQHRSDGFADRFDIVHNQTRVRLTATATLQNLLQGWGMGCCPGIRRLYGTLMISGANASDRRRGSVVPDRTDRAP